jgi:hypothetical protein
MATKKPVKTYQGFPDVHLKPGMDNLLIALQAIVDGKLPVSAVSLKLNALREWAHRTVQPDGEIHGLLIKSRKGEV